MLLFDQVLSFKLCARFSVEFAGSIHVSQAGISRKSDGAVWDFAAANNLAIISKDQDFRQRALLFGPPPKCIWLRLGNCSTKEIAALLEARKDLIHSFAQSERALLILDRKDYTLI